MPGHEQGHEQGQEQGHEQTRLQMRPQMRPQTKPNARRADVRLSKSSMVTDNGYGIFISHGGGDAAFTEISSLFDAQGISYRGDSQLVAGEDFHQSLREMMRNAAGAVILLSGEALDSPWVMYEIGLIEGMGKSLVLYIPEQRSDVESRIPEFLRSYEIVYDIGTLAEIAISASAFDDIFRHETPDLSLGDFRSAIGGKRSSVRLTVGIPNLSRLAQSGYSFGLIVVRLAEAGEVAVDPVRCPVMRQSRNGDNCRAHPDAGVQCAALSSVLCEEHVETVALNSILATTAIRQDEVEYLLPLHNHFGVTFKCFVDVSDISMKATLESLLAEAGMLDISHSDSGEGQRIYFLLPESRRQGLHHVRAPEGFYNNFICPGAI